MPGARFSRTSPCASANSVVPKLTIGLETPDAVMPANAPGKPVTFALSVTSIGVRLMLTAPLTALPAASTSESAGNVSFAPSLLERLPPAPASSV